MLLKSPAAPSYINPDQLTNNTYFWVALSEYYSSRKTQAQSCPLNESETNQLRIRENLSSSKLKTDSLRASLLVASSRLLCNPWVLSWLLSSVTVNQRHRNKAAQAGDPALRLTHSPSGQGKVNLSAPHSWAYVRYYHITRLHNTLTIISVLNYTAPYRQSPFKIISTSFLPHCF